MSTYIIIILIVAVGLFIGYLISATMRKWMKWIGAGILAIGGIILLIVTLGKKKSDKKSDAKIETDKTEIIKADDKIKEDQAKISEKDKEIKKQEDSIQKTADDAKQKEKEQESKPDKPDQGKAGDDFNSTWNK
jgi:putative Mn2+ efflux pump MntP